MAFLCCNNLIEVWNYSKLSIVAGESAFGYVGYYAKYVYTEDTESKQITDQDGYVFFLYEGNMYLISYRGNETRLVLPEKSPTETDYEIYQYAFYTNKKIISVTIPSSVTSIGSWAFSWCSSLQSIIFEGDSQLQSIGYNAFYECISLTSITIPSSVTSIGSGAFYNCDSLMSITIPSSVTSIGSYAFLDCTNLMSVTFENPTGWNADGISVTFDDPTRNAKYLTSTYSRSRLIRE